MGGNSHSFIVYIHEILTLSINNGNLGLGDIAVNMISGEKVWSTD